MKDPVPQNVFKPRAKQSLFFGFCSFIFLEVLLEHLPRYFRWPFRVLSILIFYIFFNFPLDKQRRSVRPFCCWGEHFKGLGNQAEFELDMINAISAADIAFIMSSSQAIVNWLNALDQSDFLWWVWCIIIKSYSPKWRWIVVDIGN